MQVITHATDSKPLFLQFAIRYVYVMLLYIVPIIDFQGIFPIGRNGSMVCVEVPLENNEYGVVSVVNRSLYCLLCRRACKHSLHVEQLIESECCPESLEMLSMFLQSSQTNLTSLHPQWEFRGKKTPFLLLPSQQSILRKGVLSFLTSGSEDELIIPSSTEPQHCPSCRSVLLKCQVSLPFIFERSVHKGLGKIKNYAMHDFCLGRYAIKNIVCGLMCEFTPPYNPRLKCILT